MKDVPLDEPEDLRRIRQMMLEHLGIEGSPCTTVVLVENFLRSHRESRERLQSAIRSRRPTSTGELREDER
jgi:hypothetical protein